MALPHIWSEIIDEANRNLPQFNRYTLKGYRQDKIREIPDMLDMIFSEAVKRYGYTPTGEQEVVYKGHRFLTPEECLALDAANTKFSSMVDILRTEQAPMELMFEHRGTPFTTMMYIPYLCEDAIIINGSKYYVMFALTDKVFYHIVKNHGIGIKILCAHLRFWRMFRYSFTSLSGRVYGDHIVITKIHLREYKYTADDLQTALLLYPLIRFGLKETLVRYGINPEHVKLVLEPDKGDVEFEYFYIPLEDEEKTGRKNGVYLKVHQDVLKNYYSEGKNKIHLQVVAALHYILTYFQKVKESIYRNDREKFCYMFNDDPTFTVYKVILGKTVFGINYESEIQVAGHIKDHLQSLELYMDPETKRKLRTIGVEADDVYDLIHYVSLHMNEYVANYFPSNVYEKQMNVLDLLMGSMVNTLFLRIYRQTNNRKGDRPYTTEQIMSSLRVGSKIFSHIYACSGLIAGNPSVYNDNGLLTVLGRRKRATFSTAKAGSNNANKKKGGSDVNLLQDPEHRTHSSLYIVESGTRTQTTDPTKSGTLNGFLIVTPDGEIIIPDWIKEIASGVDKYIHSK